MQETIFFFGLKQKQIKNNNKNYKKKETKKKHQFWLKKKN